MRYLFGLLAAFSLLIPLALGYRETEPDIPVRVVLKVEPRGADGVLPALLASDPVEFEIK